MTLGIVSWNCDGLLPHLPDEGEKATRGASLAEVAAQLGGPKVLCLQELRVRPQDTAIVKAMETALLGATCHASLCRDDKNVTFRGGRMYGVATWVRAPVVVTKAYSFPWDLEGRVIVTEIASHNIAIVNVYAVNGTDKPYWDHDLGRYEGDRHAYKRRWNARLFDECAALRESTGLDLVMIGDWNISRTKMDTFPRLRTEEPHALARRMFNDELLPKLGVVDAFRELHPEARKYSWFNRQARGNRLDASRVDFALVSTSLLPDVVEADILEAREHRFLSDHAPLTLILSR